MQRCLMIAIGVALTALPLSQLSARDRLSLSDVFSIRSITGGYYLRTVSSKGDRIDAKCQLLRKGVWDFTVEVYPTNSPILISGRSPSLELGGTWTYPLSKKGQNLFSWVAPDSAAFALFLQRISALGWEQSIVSRQLNVDFKSHGSDDAGTIAAFAHLCRLPALPNAY